MAHKQPRAMFFRHKLHQGQPQTVSAAGRCPVSLGIAAHQRRKRLGRESGALVVHGNLEPSVNLRERLAHYGARWSMAQRIPAQIEQSALQQARAAAHQGQNFVAADLLFSHHPKMGATHGRHHAQRLHFGP